MARRFTLAAAVLIAVAVVLPGVPAGALRPGGAARGQEVPDPRYPWAGQWTSSFGGFAFSVRTEGNGRELLEKIGGKVCPGSSQYYAGGFNNTDDQGKIRGCTSGGVDHLVGRFESNRTKQRGSFDIKRNGSTWAGTWSVDGGNGGRWNGAFKGHFEGDRPAAAPAKRECPKTYIVQPSGKKITANIKLVDLDPKQIAGVISKEKDKYAGFDYSPIGPVTRKQNCAGYVMQKLFGRKMVQANVEPDGFFRKIVVPYGSKRFGRSTARAGDVVVYRDEAGIVKHVAIVASGGVTGTTILTKDGNERLYRAAFPLGPLRLSTDPLVQAHAGQGKGSVEFWKLDRKRVSIRAVSPAACDG